jgi:Domain of unknown function (DUF4136)
VRRRLAMIAFAAVVGSVVLHADDLSVNYDPDVDFTPFKTIKMREKVIESPRPELDNTLFIKKLERTIEEALEGKGLREADNIPDLFVDFKVTGEDVNTTRRGTPISSLPGTGMRGRSTGPETVRYTTATLVIDLVRPGDPMPIWRGVYRDDEKTGSKLVQKLPEDAQKLIARYPPKK